MALPRRRTPFVRAKSDRQSVWIGFDISETAVGGNTVVLVGVLNAAALALRPFTVVRSRLEILWNSDQFTATEEIHGAFGAIIVSDQATAAGVASIPDPITNSDAPFFIYEPFITRFNFLTSAGFESNGGFHQTVDSKSMRKVGSNEDLAFVAVNSDAAHSAVVSITGRVLIKLH